MIDIGILAKIFIQSICIRLNLFLNWNMSARVVKIWRKMKIVRASILYSQHQNNSLVKRVFVENE